MLHTVELHLPDRWYNVTLSESVPVHIRMNRSTTVSTVDWCVRLWLFRYFRPFRLYWMGTHKRYECVVVMHSDFKRMKQRGREKKKKKKKKVAISSYMDWLRPLSCTYKRFDSTWAVEGMSGNCDCIENHRQYLIHWLVTTLMNYQK